MRYFDHNATAPLLPAARAAWLEVEDSLWANPASASRLAARAHHRLEACRRVWAEAFSLSPDRVVFTSGATESNNAVIAELARRSPPTARVLVSAIEHPSVLEAAEGWFPGRVDRIGVDGEGVVRLDELEARADPKVHVLVALMAANNETGVAQPWAEAAVWCERRGLPLLCDAAQWVGRFPAKALPPVSYYTFSGHKFGAPKGVGAILLGEGASRFCGQKGGGQEQAHRAGTVDVAGIAALTAAFEAQPAAGWPGAGKADFLRARSPSYTPIGRIEGALPNTLSLRLPRFPAVRWIPRLEAHGYIVSSGSACSTGRETPSHVLAAMGLEAESARRVIRLSAGLDTPVEAWRGLWEALETVRRELEDDAASDRLTTIVEI